MVIYTIIKGHYVLALVWRSKKICWSSHLSCNGCPKATQSNQQKYKHWYNCCQLWKGVNLKWPRIFLYWFHTCCGPLCRCRHPHRSCWVFPKILHPHSTPLPSSCSCWVWMSSVRTELTRPHYKPRWGQSQMSPSEGCSCLQSCFPVGKHFQLCKEGNNYFAI